MDGRTWLQRSLLATQIIVFISSVVIGALALGKDSNKKAGILNLQFNFTSVLSTLRRPMHDRGLIESMDFYPTSIASILETAGPLASDAGNVVGGFGTVISEVASQVQSVADPIATLMSPAIEARFPRNCSIGTGLFCIGLAETVSCHSLPLNMSGIIPSEVRDILPGFESINGLDAALAKLTTAAMRDLWVVGLVLCSVMIASSLLFMFRYVSVAKVWRIAFYLVIGAILCALFIVPLVILRTLHSKLGSLPSWIEIRQGDITGLLAGGLCCAIFLIVSCAAVLTVF